MLVPLSYNLRSLFVRRSSTLLTVVGIGATVAVVAGVLALRQGFASLFSGSGREDVAVFLRPGSTNESDSFFRRDLALKLTKGLPEAATGEDGVPLTSMECFLAVRRFRIGGGETNVPIRGVQPPSFAVYGDDVAVVEGRRFEPGADEVMVGRRLPGRIRDCRVGDVVQINTTPFQVVGVFESKGPFESEIWGDLDRMLAALERPGPSRVVARLRSGADLEALDRRLRDDKEVPAKALSQRAYRASLTGVLEGALEERNYLRCDKDQDRLEGCDRDIDLQRGGVILMTPGTVTSFVPNPDHIHMTGVSEDRPRAVSLHLYGRALHDFHVYDPDAGTRKLIQVTQNES